MHAPHMGPKMVQVCGSLAGRAERAGAVHAHPAHAAPLLVRFRPPSPGQWHLALSQAAPALRSLIAGSRPDELQMPGSLETRASTISTAASRNCIRFLNGPRRATCRYEQAVLGSASRFSSNSGTVTQARAAVPGPIQHDRHHCQRRTAADGPAVLHARRPVAGVTVVLIEHPSLCRSLTVCS